MLIRKKWPVAAALIRSPRFDAQRFLDFVRSHSVAKHLYNHLQRHGHLNLLPADLAEEMRICHAIRTDNGNRLISELLSLHAELEAAGIEGIFFKGPVLSKLYYCGDNIRRFWDLDLLLRDRRDLRRVHALLTRRGFARRSKTPLGDRTAAFFSHAYDYVRPDEPAPTIIDVHWTLSTHFSFRIDEARLWGSTVCCDLRGENLRALSVEYDLVQLMLAVLRDTERGRLRAKLLVDLYVVAISIDPTINWAEFFAVRGSERLERIAQEVFGLMLDLLDCREDLPRLTVYLDTETDAPRRDLDQAHALIVGSSRVLRNKLWAFRLYRGGILPSLAWWAVSLPVRMAVFRQ